MCPRWSLWKCRGCFGFIMTGAKGWRSGCYEWDSPMWQDTALLRRCLSLAYPHPSPSVVVSPLLPVSPFSISLLFLPQR